MNHGWLELVILMMLWRTSILLCITFQRLLQSSVTRSGLHLIRSAGHSPRVFQTLHNLSDSVSWTITVLSLARKHWNTLQSYLPRLPLHPLPFAMVQFHTYSCVIKPRSKDFMPNSSTMRAEKCFLPRGWRDCEECDTLKRWEADSSASEQGLPYERLPRGFICRRCWMCLKLIHWKIILHLNMILWSDSISEMHMMFWSEGHPNL